MSTVTWLVALVRFLTASTCVREIFWMMADLLRPVPAARAPAFWTKKTSSVGSYLLNVQSPCARPHSDLIEKDERGNEPDNSLVVQRIRRLLGDERQGRVLADDSVEGVVVDVERLRQEILEGDAGGRKALGSIDHGRGRHFCRPYCARRTRGKGQQAQARQIRLLSAVGGRETTWTAVAAPCRPGVPSLFFAARTRRTIEAFLVDELSLRGQRLSLCADGAWAQRPLHVHADQHGGER